MQVRSRGTRVGPGLCELPGSQGMWTLLALGPRRAKGKAAGALRTELLL